MFYLALIINYQTYQFFLIYSFSLCNKNQMIKISNDINSPSIMSLKHIKGTSKNKNSHETDYFIVKQKLF